ncbi:30S ribosomal protein S16 [bacterium]|nr:30S ribosomal protein S16 [candidate division CSSED10-310 bacterium]
MATRIRLQRIGAKKNAFYRIVVADQLTAPSSKVVDYLGTYDPHKNPPEVKMDFVRLDEWLSKGATPTEKSAAIIRKARKLSASTPAE